MIKPKKFILEAKGYATQLFAEDLVLKLDLNENLIGPSPLVLKAIEQIKSHEVQYYPAYGELITSIASNSGVSTEMVLPTNGADEALSFVIQAFIDQEDEILTVNPSFVMSKIYARQTGCTYTEVPYQEKWVFPIDEFLSKINAKTKLIILTSPNSPTGELMSGSDIDKILEKSAHSLVIIDETYANYLNKTYVDYAKKYNNVAIVKSMSKDFAIAGLRLGYIIANPQIIEYITRIASPFSVNISAAKAGVAALQDKAHFEFVKQETKKAKECLIEILKPFAQTIYPSGTNFMLVDFGEKAQYVEYKLNKAKIKPKFYGQTPHLENCSRMTIPSPDKCHLIKDALQSRPVLAFDMDGVLIDTTNSYRMAIKNTFEFFAKKELSFEEIQNAKNLGGLNNDWDLTEFLLKQAGVNIAKNAIIDKFQGLYWGNSGDGFIKNEKLIISELELRELSKSYEMVIFTGRPRQEALFALKEHNLEGIFGYLIGHEDVPEDKHKPHSYGLNKIIEITAPTEIYYLGDTADDMISAKNAGAIPIGVLPPQDKSDNLKSKLIENGAKFVLGTTGELKNLLETQLCESAQ